MGSVEIEYTFGEQELRRAERKRLTIPATLHPAKSKRFKTWLKDLSLAGFSAAAAAVIAVDTLCSVTIPERGPMQARVVWWRAGLVGCAFAEPMGRVAYDAILERWED
jgi:hypothetical protein